MSQQVKATKPTKPTKPTKSTRSLQATQSAKSAITNKPIKDRFIKAFKGKFSNETYLSLISPILSIAILVLGMGAITTFTTLRLHDFNCTKWLIGLVSASYFVGLTIGGYKAQHLVLRVGHIRSYAAFSAIFAVSILLQGLFEIPRLWVLLRFISGFCLAGCFLVIESWLLGASNRKNRGIILAVYMISYYGGQGIGQFFLKIPGIEVIEIYIVGALFFALSIVPVSITRFHAPYAEEPSILSFKTLNKKAPVAIWGAFCAGFTLSVLYSLYPLYLSFINWEQGDVAIFVAALLFGATVAQYPVGWVSDRYDRRLIIAGVLILCVVTLLVILFDHSDYYRLLCYTMLLGAAAFTVYPLSINHGVDSFSSKDLISATAGIMLAYGIGSSIGPGIISLLMYKNIFDTSGFIYGLTFVAFVTLLYIAYMIKTYEAMAEAAKSQYVPVPDTTVEVVQLDPEVRERDIKAHHIDSIEKDEIRNKK